MNIRLESLDTFTKVVDKGSLLAAAKSLGMSVSTVSVQIGSVEKFFNAKLLERKASGVELTREGKLVYQNIREVLDHVEKTKRLLESFRTKDIYVAIDCVGVPLIAKIQMLYKEKNPDVDILVRLRGSQNCFRRLDENEVSIIIVGYLSSNPNREKYVVEEIGRDKLVLLVPPNHELAKKDKVYIRDVLSYPMVTLAGSYGITSRLEEVLNKERIKSEDLSIECSVDDVFAQIYGVSSGLGTAITSYILAVKYDEGGLVKIREIEDFTDKRPIYVICNKIALKNPEIKNFFEFVVEQGKVLVEEYKV